jgi:hypothetical protein
MIKRWIARRRRRIDIFDRLRKVEAHLGCVEENLSSLSESRSQGQRHVAELQGGASELADGVSAIQGRVAWLEERIASLEGRLDDRSGEIAKMQEHLTVVEDRTTDISHRSHEAAEAFEQRLQEGASVAESLAHKTRAIQDDLWRMNIRAARLETQRQVDIEENRRFAVATLQELKRVVLRWRDAGDMLAEIDHAMPSRRYVGRPWEERAAIRLRPNLASGAPLAEVAAEGKLHIAALTAEGAPCQDAPLPTDLGPETWVAFAPAGSVVSPDFGRIVLEHAGRCPDASIFYADDLAVDTDEPVDQLRLKPAFDLTLLAAQDYIGAPLIVRVDALRALGGLNPAMKTAACSDLLFRAHANGMSIQRIPEVLLAHPGRRVRASAADYRAMLEAQESLAPFEVCSGSAVDTFRLERRFTPANAPPVSLLIPTRRTTPPGSNTPYIERLLTSIAGADWPMDKLTVIVGDDHAGVPDWALRRWPFTLRRIETPRAADEPFNYAAKMNRLWRAAETEQIVFMNDDVRAIDGGWLRALQTFAMDTTVGGVGARLLFEDGSLQHAGMAPHGAGTAHLWVQRLGSQGVYQNWAQVHREWSMVTGAIFATRRNLMEQVGGFDEQFSLEFNDTDLAMRLRKAGRRIVFTPFAQMVHVERASRGGTPPPRDEEALFYARWGEWLANDPSWHPQMDSTRVEVMPVPAPDAWYL